MALNKHNVTGQDLIGFANKVIEGCLPDYHGDEIVEVIKNMEYRNSKDKGSEEYMMANFVLYNFNALELVVNVVRQWQDYMLQIGWRHGEHEIA